MVQNAQSAVPEVSGGDAVLASGPWSGFGRAAQPPHIIEAVVDHKRPGMTLGRYSGGLSVEEQMRACVEAACSPVEELSV